MESQGREEEDEPRDAKVVKSLLRSMGVQRYEPRVVHQFLDFCHRYVCDILSDAQDYSEHAGKSAIDCDDVKMAIQSRVNLSFSQPPPRETLLELARLRNSVPLPKTIGSAGIALPPDQDTLIAPNYQLVIPSRGTHYTEEETEADQEEDNAAQVESDKGGSHATAALMFDQDSGRKVSFALPTKLPKG